MGDVEALGLLKMDFLGLRNLDVIDKAVELIGSRGIRLDIDALPLDDSPTYEMLARGEATGVFQFESSGMREALRQVKPTEFEDLIALGALYRPGPMQYIPDVRRAQGRPRAGHLRRPAPEADPRRARTASASTRSSRWRSPRRSPGSPRRGRRPAQGDRQEDPRADGLAQGQVHRGLRQRTTPPRRSRGSSGTTIEKAQDYSFNKSHAACYALIAYRTAWLRANHPVRVHGGADQLGDEHQGPRAVLRQRRATSSGSRCCRPTSTSRRSTSPSSTGRSASGSTPSRASASSPCRTIIARPRRRRPVRVDLGLQPSGSTRRS